MSARRRGSSNEPFWQRVRRMVWCVDGCGHKACDYSNPLCPDAGTGHAVPSSTWALFWPFRYDRRRMVRCEAHARALGYVRPVPDATAMPRDGKAEALGGDQ
jgi:hypothetical protein